MLGGFFFISVLILKNIDAQNQYPSNIITENSLRNMKNSYKIITKARSKNQKYRFNDGKGKTVTAPPPLDLQFVTVPLLSLNLIYKYIFIFL